MRRSFRYTVRSSRSSCSVHCLFTDALAARLRITGEEGDFISPDLPFLTFRLDKSPARLKKGVVCCCASLESCGVKTCHMMRVRASRAQSSNNDDNNNNNNNNNNNKNTADAQNC